MCLFSFDQIEFSNKHTKKRHMRGLRRVVPVVHYILVKLKAIITKCVCNVHAYTLCDNRFSFFFCFKSRAPRNLNCLQKYLWISRNLYCLSMEQQDWLRFKKQFYPIKLSFSSTSIEK